MKFNPETLITDYSKEALRERVLSLLSPKEEKPGKKKLERLVQSGGCYSNIFSVVKEMPLGDQERLITDFYSGFLNGKELGSYIFKLLQIDWFNPKQKHTKEALQSYTDSICDSFKLERKKASITRDLNAAWGAAGDAVWDAVWGAARGAARDVAGDASWDAARDAAWGAARHAARYAARDAPWDASLDAVGGAAWGAVRDVAGDADYIVVSDSAKLKKQYPENPFEKLIDVYALGLWPAGISGNKFVIWHPEVKE